MRQDCTCINVCTLESKQYLVYRSQSTSICLTHLLCFPETSNRSPLAARLP